MPLNKLDNFIKNTEGRILYVSPSDLDATDSITNSGNSLARPFKTIQRALIESARFSYQTGNGNDLIERTTILLMLVTMRLIIDLVYQFDQKLLQKVVDFNWWIQMVPMLMLQKYC